MPKPSNMRLQNKWLSFLKLTALIRQWWYQLQSKNKKPPNWISNNIQPNFSRKGIASSTSKIKSQNSRDSKWREEVSWELQKCSKNKSSPSIWKGPTWKSATLVAHKLPKNTSISSTRKVTEWTLNKFLTTSKNREYWVRTLRIMVSQKE